MFWFRPSAFARLLLKSKRGMGEKRRRTPGNDAGGVRYERVPPSRGDAAGTGRSGWRLPVGRDVPRCRRPGHGSVRCRTRRKQGGLRPGIRCEIVSDSLAVSSRTIAVVWFLAERTREGHPLRRYGGSQAANWAKRAGGRTAFRCEANHAPYGWTARRFHEEQNKGVFGAGLQTACSSSWARPL